MSTKRIERWGVLAVGVAAVLLTLAACAPKSPEERVAELRTRYRAELNGFYEQRPTAPAAVAEAGEAVAEAAAAEATAVAGEAAEEGEMEAEEVPEEMGPRTSDILLDILILHDANERLDGITVDITLVDPAEVEKAAWKVWIDTSKITKATHHQVSHVLEDVEYEEGDGFSVEVRSYIPPEERGDYREFLSAGG